MAAHTRRKLARRKATQERRKPGFFIRRILLALLLSIVLWGSSRIFNSFQNRVWREGTRITFVVDSENPVVYSFSPETGKLLFFEIPKDTQITVAGGYGTFPVASLWELGQQKGKGGDLLRLSIQRSLGIPVDAWIGEGGAEFFSPRPLGRVTAFKEAIVKGGIETSLTFFDRVAIFMNVSSVNFVDRRSLDLEASRVLRREKFLDGAEGYVVVPETAKLVFEVLRDESIVREGKTLVVINATPQRGLARMVADIAGVLGMRVVAVQTEGEEKDGICIVRGKKGDLESLSARRLSQVFQCKIEEGAPSGASSLEIILGRDFVNTF